MSIQVVLSVDGLPTGYAALWLITDPSVIVIAPSDQAVCPRLRGEEKVIKGAVAVVLDSGLKETRREECSICRLHQDGSGYFRAENLKLRIDAPAQSFLL